MYIRIKSEKISNLEVHSEILGHNGLNFDLTSA